MFAESLNHAWRGSISKSGAWAPVPGALLLFAGAWLMNYSALLVMPTTVLGGVLFFLICASISWVLIFFGRLLYAPYALGRLARDRLASLDLAYGLAFVGLIPSLDKTNTTNCFEIRMTLRNTCDFPLTFQVVSWITMIGGRSVKTAYTPSAILHKGGEITVFPSGGLSSQEFRALKAYNSGSANIEIRYGHPDLSRRRRAVVTLRLDVNKSNAGKKSESVHLNWIIQDQLDEPTNFIEIRAAGGVASH